MGDPVKDNPEYLKIGDAARFLGINRRTVYRWILSGELPAARVGGLYFIRKSDLQARLSISPVTSKNALEQDTQLLKCAYCFHLLSSDLQVGGVCAEPGCDEIICAPCKEEGNLHCTRHSPTREKRLERAHEQFQRGEIPVLVPASTARLRELNFLHRVETRLTSISTLLHPQTSELITIKEWAEVLEHGDERAEVMELLNRVVIDTSTLNQTPLNAWFTARPPLPPKSRALPVVIHARLLSRIRCMLRDGYDTQPLTPEDLLPWLVKLSDKGEPTNSFDLVLLASVTGWDDPARQVIQGAGRKELPFASPNRLFYLFDLEKSELIYDVKDERARRYAELFMPILPAEELEDAICSVEREMHLYDSLTLQYAKAVLPFSEKQLTLAFERLAATGRYALTNVPQLGLAITRQ